jgi:hypothetical protein
VAKKRRTVTKTRNSTKKNKNLKTWQQLKRKRQPGFNVGEIERMKADLQKPLELAIIDGMFIGTLVSLFFIPLMYYLLKRM